MITNWQSHLHMPWQPFGGQERSQIICSRPSQLTSSWSSSLHVYICNCTVEKQRNLITTTTMRLLLQDSKQIMLSWSSAALLRAAVGWVEPAGKGSCRGHRRSFRCARVESPASHQRLVEHCYFSLASNRLQPKKRTLRKEDRVHHQLHGSEVHQWIGTPSSCGNWHPSDAGCQPSDLRCRLEWWQSRTPHRMTGDWKKNKRHINMAGSGIEVEMQSWEKLVWKV